VKIENDEKRRAFLSRGSSLSCCKEGVEMTKNTPTVLYIWVNKTVELFFLEKSPRDENRPFKNYRTKPETGK
jgi:hypothetical protein